MNQLEPSEKFIITRQLEDPVDTATYYIKAYVRNAQTDALLETIILEDKGEQRFRGSFYVPQDPSGQGLYITITTKVFTDSGYTTESNLYGRVEEEFLVQQRWNRILGGGGGADFSYKRIREIVQEEIKKIKLPEPKNITKYNTIKEEINLDVLKNQLDSIKESIKAIKIPEPDKADLTSILKGLVRLEEAIGNIKIPETDLSVVSKEAKKTLEAIAEIKEEIIEYNNKLQKKPILFKLSPEELVGEETKKRRKVFL